MSKNKFFLFATHRGLFTLEYDPASESTHVSLVREGHSYGIASRDNIVYVKHEDSVIGKYQFENDSLKLLKEIELKFPVSPKAVHQITIDYNGDILITDTDNNRVITINDNGELIAEYNLGPIGQDVLHLNSVFPTEKKIHILAHMKNTPPSKLIVIDNKQFLSNRKEKSLFYGGCHNIYLKGQEVFYCASSIGRFVKYNLVTERLHDLYYQGHVKGLSVVGDEFFCGVSDVKERSERAYSHCSLAIIDNVNFRKKNIIPLQCKEFGRELGNFNEIRCLSETDLSLNSSDSKLTTL